MVPIEPRATLLREERPTDVSTVQAVTHFLHQEARLLDDHRYAEWLELWAPQGILYWVPLDPLDDSNGEKLSLFCDDRYRLAKRVERLGDSFVLAQQPKSRMLRMLGNIEVFHASPEARLTSVASSLHLTEQRRGETYSWVGRVEHLLAYQEGRYQIRRKTVRLINADEALPVVSFLF